MAGLSVAVALGARQAGTPAETMTPVAAETERTRPLLPHTRPDCAVQKCVALTFDDGPGPQTRALLRMLRRANAVATWFPVGEVAAAHPERLRAIARAGHEIGNHSWSHPVLPRQGDLTVAGEITRTADVVERATGVRPRLVRPPYGALSPRVRVALKQLGAPIVLWDVDPLDWKYRDADLVHRNVVDFVRPGSIVLLHDIHASTVAAVPLILATLAAQGYTFVSVSDLFGTALRAGRVHTDHAAA
ncbi:polysaccharide deacetylase family protein [Sporichthya brevicatena]|uniref:polysaccharide deacetylase family protein n=1 Tax=Sporichthya brevicatena TaxID=171442 RepID=UPI0031D962DB